MKKSDRESLLQSLHNRDEKILRCDVVTKLTATFKDDMLLKDQHTILMLALYKSLIHCNSCYK